MIEKMLSFEELKNINLNGQELKKIYENLEQIGFFSNEEGDENKYCRKIFSILRKTPDNKDNLNGQDYIKEEYFENGKAIKGKVYNFNLKMISSCS